MSRSTGNCSYRLMFPALYSQKMKLCSKNMENEIQKILVQKYDLSSVKGCVIQILVFHREIAGCQSSYMYKMCDVSGIPL